MYFFIYIKIFLKIYITSNISQGGKVKREREGEGGEGGEEDNFQKQKKF